MYVGVQLERTSNKSHSSMNHPPRVELYIELVSSCFSPSLLCQQLVRPGKVRKPVSLTRHSNKALGS